MKPLRVIHLFPELLNLYADQGNIAVLRDRAQRRGWPVKVEQVRLRQELDLADADIVLLGGGSDREQEVVARALPFYRADLAAAIEAGLPVLAVCGGYQLLGEYYELVGGGRIAGLHVVDMATEAGEKRLIGNVVVEALDATGRATGETVVGFENHMGRTHHDYPAFGRVLRGYGNNGKDGLEGLCHKGIIATYIHGPLLPKNPHVADRLLRAALRYRGRDEPLPPLDDALEWDAHNSVLHMLGLSERVSAREDRVRS